MERARQFVGAAGQDAHQKLTATENALQAFKQKNHVADLTQEPRRPDRPRHTPLTADYQKAQNGPDHPARPDRRQPGRAEPGAGHGHASRPSATNTVIAALQDDIRELEVQRVGLTQPGGLTPNAPQVRALDAQIADPAGSGSPRSRRCRPARPSPRTPCGETLRAKMLDLQAQVPAPDAGRG